MLSILIINILLAVFVSTDVSSLDSQDIKYSDSISNYYDQLQIYNTSKHVFYWLYTNDRTEGQLLNRSEPHMTESTTYNPENSIKVVVHGWLDTIDQKQNMCYFIVKSYLQVGNYNVICVDWKQYSTDLSYAVAKIRAKYIGYNIAEVLRRITCNMTEGVENIHLIGHSLGAHFVGFTGKNLTDQIPRITGLDPSRPLYEDSGPKDRLDHTDAKFVDVMHTNGDQNGLFEALGHIDYFPNGGKKQPNCEKSDKPTGSCSHNKAYLYFSHSICAKDDYIAYKCSSWKDFEAQKCNNSGSTPMGEYVDKKKSGNFYLRTSKEDLNTEMFSI